MSIRVLILSLLVTGLSIYAWKDWFKSLCGLIIMMAVLENRDVPTAIMGIPGLNLWNALFVMIVLAWAVNRGREGLVWDMPRGVGVLLLLYLGVVVVGVVRAIFDRGQMQGYPLGSLINEELVNTVKWVLPGILLFDGVRTRRRVITALICILIPYVLIAVQVVRFMPLSAALGDAAVLERSRISLGRYINYTAVNISAMLAGASWGILTTLALLRTKKLKVVVLAPVLVVVLGQALTGGRAGYLAWAATGLVLCLLKWRRYLLVVPVIAVVVPILMPGVVDRIFLGFGETSPSGESTVDRRVVTSGRADMWPLVIDKIGESPWFGHGRQAMRRTGLTAETTLELGEPFAHPHCMYLETLLDNGLLGSLPIFLFWGTIVAYALTLFRSGNHLYSAAGGLALALTLAQLFAGIGAQHFYPRSITLGWWAAVFLMLRVYVEEKQAELRLTIVEGSWSPPVNEWQAAHVSP